MTKSGGLSLAHFVKIGTGTCIFETESMHGWVRTVSKVWDVIDIR